MLVCRRRAACNCGSDWLSSDSLAVARPKPHCCVSKLPVISRHLSTPLHKLPMLWPYSRTTAAHAAGFLGQHAHSLTPVISMHADMRIHLYQHFQSVV